MVVVWSGSLTKWWRVRVIARVRVRARDRDAVLLLFYSTGLTYKMWWTSLLPYLLWIFNEMTQPFSNRVNLVYPIYHIVVRCVQLTREGGIAQKPNHDCNKTLCLALEYIKNCRSGVSFVALGCLHGRSDFGLKFDRVCKTARTRYKAYRFSLWRTRVEGVSFSVPCFAAVVSGVARMMPGHSMGTLRFWKPWATACRVEATRGAWGHEKFNPLRSVLPLGAISVDDWPNRGYFRQMTRFVCWL